MLELKDIVKQIDGDETHIYPTTLTLEAGCFNTLLGTTLAGKTTLMRLMAGLEKPTEGSIFFNQANVTGVPVQRRNVSMVYQQFINYPNMSVYDNIASPLRVAGMRTQAIDKHVGSIAELLRISSFLKRRPNELSGGQQQRTAMARALVKEADLILLDEPLANLDFKLREDLRDELPKLFAKRECVIVYATTEPMEALLFGGQTIALNKGRVVDYGPSATIYRRPSNLESANVFSDPPLNIAKVTKSDDIIIMNDNVRWSIDQKFSNGDYTVAIRPHLVSLHRMNEEAIPIEGTVRVAELSGSESMIHFEAYGNSWISLSHGIHPFESGQQAVFYVDVSSAFYFAADGQLINPLSESGMREYG